MDDTYTQSQNKNNSSTFEFDRPVNRGAANPYGYVSPRGLNSSRGRPQEEPMNPYWSYKDNEHPLENQNRYVSPNRAAIYSPGVSELHFFNFISLFGS